MTIPDNAVATTSDPNPVDGDPALLVVDGLTKHFPIGRGLFGGSRKVLKAVDAVDLSVADGQTVGLVGESGCGKTTTGRMVARLTAPTSGRLVFQGRDVTHLRRPELRRLRQKIQIMFQDPYSSLSPRMIAKEIIAEPLRSQGLYGAGGERRVAELLDLVGLSSTHGQRYPHEFSGGQRQRIGLARALAPGPDLVVLDEPVSALDVSIQAQIVNLLKDLQGELGLSYLFISHDLSVVRNISHRVVVMYLGKVVESGTRSDIFSAPQHPYTQALLSAVPVPHPRMRGQRPRITVPGDTAPADTDPVGCPFRSRCWKAQEICQTSPPTLEDKSGTGHHSACHFPQLPSPSPGPSDSPSTPHR